MSDSGKNAKVISITRGFRKAAAKQRLSPVPSPLEDTPLQQFLHHLHPRVRAVLVAGEGQWRFFERVRDDPESRSVLTDIALLDLLAILARARSHEEISQRITISPWKGFDLAVLLRQGKPYCAACLDADTSVYVAEEVLPKVAAFFDENPPA